MLLDLKIKYFLSKQRCLSAGRRERDQVLPGPRALAAELLHLSWLPRRGELPAAYPRCSGDAFQPSPSLAAHQRPRTDGSGAGGRGGEARHLGGGFGHLPPPRWGPPARTSQKPPAEQGWEAGPRATEAPSPPPPPQPAQLVPAPRRGSQPRRGEGHHPHPPAEGKDATGNGPAGEAFP